MMAAVSRGRGQRPVLGLVSFVLFVVFLWGKPLPQAGGPSHANGWTRLISHQGKGQGWGSSYSYRSSRHLLGFKGTPEASITTSRHFQVNSGSGSVSSSAAASSQLEQQQQLQEQQTIGEEAGAAHFIPTTSNGTTTSGSGSSNHHMVAAVSCPEVVVHPGYPDACTFVKATPACQSGSVVDYTSLFFCYFGAYPSLGYAAYAAWLMALFYMLGNTAADYYCCSVERLARLLHLPPTVAGVTLLPLGNGAPDVFASIAAFMGAGAGEVGLNSILGGAFFVSSVVAGSVSLAVAASESVPHLHRRSFVRDIVFFLVTVAALVVVLVKGVVTLWGAAAYLSIYVVYGVAVGLVEWRKKVGGKNKRNKKKNKAANTSAAAEEEQEVGGDEEGGGHGVRPELQPLLRAQTSLPQWRWAPHVALFAHLGQVPYPPRPLWGWSDADDDDTPWYTPRGLFRYLVEWPLALPRRLTIPVIDSDKWSRPYAIASATLAPLLFALVWDGKDSGPFMSSWRVYIGGTAVGLCLGAAAFFTTTADHPPRRVMLPWVLAGFLMSILWFYVIANELVATLVALGIILQIDAAVLGLTLLAWGNSVGDLMSNLALSVSGGDSVQIAIAGCYAGPMFNTLVGIGASLALAAWRAHPAPFTVPADRTLFYTLGFLVAGLLWSLAVLPLRGMRPSKTLGCGLLFIYCSFLTLRMAAVFGIVHL